MHKIADKLTQVHDRIEKTALRSHRDKSDVLLLAVSKKHGADKIREAYDWGQRDFGENYLQESIEKQDALKDLAINWHFIGPIQSNKTRAIAENFDWVHSVDRLKIAERLNNQRPPELGPINICLQVNIDNEASKSGVLPEDVADLAEQVSKMPLLRLRGLMAIPQKQSSDAASPHNRMRTLFEQTKNKLPEDFDTLSLGMSGDLEAAIENGATIVRIGTDIFGSREA